MPRRKIDDRNVRKIAHKGGSYMVTIPIEMMRELGWRKSQKVVFSKKGKTLNIKDWK